MEASMGVGESGSRMIEIIRFHRSYHCNVHPNSLTLLEGFCWIIWGLLFKIALS